jgi:hypothetical protein
MNTTIEKIMTFIIKFPTYNLERSKAALQRRATSSNLRVTSHQTSRSTESFIICMKPPSNAGAQLSGLNETSIQANE